MKRYIITVLLGMGLCHSAFAAPAPVYANYGVITTGPVIDALGFYNAGTFDLNTFITEYATGNTVGGIYSSLPYSTSETLYFTNTTSGNMSASPGFRFDEVTATTRKAGRYFVNDGTVTAEDFPAFAEYLSTSAGTTPIFADSLPLSSQLMIYCTNVFNDGTLEVGNYGLLHVEGLSISNNNGALIAGAINTGGTVNISTNIIVEETNIGQFYTTDPLDTTGYGFGYENPPYFVDPPYVYDLLWGATNGGTINLQQTSFPGTTGINSTGRGNGGAIGLLNGNFTPFVFTYTQFSPTNIYYNVVFVDTNFADSNLSVSVGFGPYFGQIPTGDDGDPNAIDDIVQFSLSTYDVITETTVTNAVYLLDGGATVTNVVLFDNASSPNGYSRPDIFEITTSTPLEWEETQPANAVYDPTTIYAPNSFLNYQVPLIAGIYEAQIGRNVENIDGRFDGAGAVLPDPTNEAGRIELNAGNLDVTRARVRSEGMVILNATNFVGGTNFSADWGEVNSSLGATNGNLLVSSFYPTNFQRVRGIIEAYSATFQNVYTNAFVTNVYHYHVLMVGQDLRGNFHSSIRNLRLQGKNSISILNPLYVINQSMFETTNLYINASVQLTDNGGNLTPTNAPYLQNFFNDTNGNLAVDSLAAFGFNPTQGESSPTKRKYSLLSVTNLGLITATAPLFDSAVFENDGTITADNNGSIVIEANTLGLGLTLTNVTNSLVADGNVTLSANVIQATDSKIYAGGIAGTGTGGALVLQTTSGGEITDFVSGAPSTNTPLVNYWQVTGGFSLPVKPATGDLFGTQIKTIANASTVANHVWAGADLGPNPAGFANNVVIGHLTLSRSTNTALLEFSGAGSDNGMYVDYLELDPNSLSYSDYRDGLVINPNLTIYFADSNVDPLKLEEVYSNRLVWVPNFSGPNSSVAVPYENSTSVCIMNAGLADSEDISFFGNVPNAYNQPYVLNNPADPSDTYPCPGEAEMMKAFVIKTTGTNISSFLVSFGAGGKITPPFKSTQVFTPGKSYTFIAEPSAGWVFSGWSGQGITNLDTNSAKLTFQYNTNLTILTANFTPDPFTLVKGVYNGLFFDTNNAPTPASSGFFTFDLGQNGSFSGRLVMGPVSYPFTSKFLPNGTAAFAARHGSSTLDVSLLLDMSDATGQVHGTVSNAAWSVQLQGDLAPTWTAKNPSPLTGRYTMAILPDTLVSGYSYGSAVVGEGGRVSVAGRLADGATFSQSVPISKAGEWPFYASAAAGRDLILGWAVFQPNEVGVTNISGTNFWSKKVGGLYYTAGFTNNNFDLIGSPYVAPKAGAKVLNLTNAVVTFNGASPITVTNSGNLTYKGEDFSITIKPATGNFSGRLGPILLNGVVLQNQDDAYGFFLGTNESVGILIQAQ